MAKAKGDRRPRWRRLNRHKLFAIHIILFVVGSAVNWSLSAPLADKQFDTLVWLAVVCLHGMIIYRNRRVALLLHLLMFSAVNGAIWTLPNILPQKITLTLAWAFIAALPGVWLFRRLYIAAPRLASPPPEPPVDDNSDVGTDEAEALEAATPSKRGRRKRG